MNNRITSTNKERNFSSYFVLDFKELEKYGKKTTHKEFVVLSEEKIDGKKLSEWFQWETTSLWWFIFPTIYQKLNEAALFIDRFLLFVEKNNITTLKIESNYGKFGLIKAICEKKGITVQVSPTGIFNHNLKNFLKLKMKPFYHKQITKKKFQKRTKLLKINSKFKTPLINSIILTSPGIYRRNSIDQMTGNPIKEEFFIQPFIDEFRKNKVPFACIDFDYTLKGDLTPLSERILNDIDWFPIEILFHKKETHSIQNSIREFKSIYKELQKNNLQKFFTYRGFSLWNYIKPTFDEVFLEPYIPTYLRLIKNLEVFLSNIEPKAIVQVYDTGPYALALEVVAKKLNIKTIGIQHGLWTFVPPEYLHKTICDYPLGCPIPDLTLVFGEHNKKILTEEGHYPPESIAVSGNLSQFYLENIKKILKKDKIYYNHNFENTKIVLIPLTYRMDFEEQRNSDLLLLDVLYRSFKDDESIMILVRPHPGDTFNQSKLQKLYPSKNFICSNQNLFKDIVVSDLVVINQSSVGLDAIMFEKPVFYVKIAEEAPEVPDVYSIIFEHQLAENVSLNDIVLRIKSTKIGETRNINSPKKKEFLKYFHNYGNTVDLMNFVLN